MHVLEERGGKLRGIVRYKDVLINVYWVRNSQCFCIAIDDNLYCPIEFDRYYTQYAPKDDMKAISMAELENTLDDLDVEGVLKCNDEWCVIVQEDKTKPKQFVVADIDGVNNVGTIDMDNCRIVESAPVEFSVAPGAVGVAFKDTSKFCGVFSTNGKDLCDVFYDSGMREYFYKDVNGKTVSFRLDDPRTGGPLEPNVLPEARKSNVYKFSKGTHGRIYTTGGMVLFEHTDKEGYYIMTLSTYDNVLSTTVGSFCPAECIV